MSDTIRDNTVSANLQRGIGVSYLATNVLIDQNLLGTDGAGLYPIGNAYDGVSCSGKHILIQGNLIGGNGTGIDISGDSSIVRDNIIGDFELSSSPLGNLYYGVNISFGKGNLIGGPAPGDMNVISGNGIHGVQVKGFSALNNVIEGNYIGTITTGLLGLGNDSSGVNITHGAKQTIVRNNLISGNLVDGISMVPLFDSIPRDNIVDDNLIGIAADSAQALPNGRFGIYLDSAWSNYIGHAGKPNYISGNDSTGIYLKNADANEFKSNVIGVLPDSTTALQNFGDGICIEQSHNNTVGERFPDEGNIIANNRGAGIRVKSGYGNHFVGNNIHANGELGIDLVGNDDEFGVTLNDSMDVDTGANSLQNTPTLTFIGHADGNTAVFGFLDGVAGQSYMIDFYEAFERDPSGFGEGDSLLDSLEVIPDASGYANFADTISGLHPHVVATATDPFFSTSEFSKSPIMVNVVVDGSDIDSSDVDCNSGGSSIYGVSECSLRAAIELADKVIGRDYIGFEIPGTYPFTIQPATTLPHITEEVSIDGTSQAGYITGDPVIHLDGVSAGSSAGLFFEIGHSTVKGFAISQFTGQGIRCSGNDLTLEDIHVTDNKKSGVDCDGDVHITKPFVAQNNGTDSTSDAGLLAGGDVTSEEMQISGNNGYGIHVKSLDAKGNIDSHDNGSDGVYSLESINIQGQTHNFTNNAHDGIISVTGRVHIEGQVAADNNGTALSETECLNFRHGGVIAGAGEVELDAVSASGNCGDGIFADTYVRIKNDASLTNNTKFGLAALGDNVFLDGSYSDISDNGSTGLLCNNGIVPHCTYCPTQ